MDTEPDIDGRLLVELLKNGYIHLIYVSGRGICGIQRMAFTVGLFYGLGEFDYRGRYCFESISDAVVALFTWDGAGDPAGDWIKHKGEGGEYSNPNYKKE
jgi:hypothetical protein